MKRHDWLMMVAGIAAVAGALPGAVADELTLTRDGAPAAAIVLAEKPTKAAQFAARELQWHVKEISGATLPIQKEGGDVPDGHVRLMVGAGTDAKALGLRRRDTLHLLRMRNGGELCRANHSLYHFYDLYWKPSANPNRAKFFVEKRPELFAKGYEGDEPPQMCYTSPELVRLVAEEARDYFNPDGSGVEKPRFNPHSGRRWGENYFSVEPMDNSSFCRCEPCQKLIESGKDHGAVESYSNNYGRLS